MPYRWTADDPPPPTAIVLGDLDLWHTIVLLAAVLILVLGVLGVFMYAVLRSMNAPQPTTLITVLAMLTFIAIAGAISSESAAIETIAATGVGALASAVSSQFRRDDDR